MKDLPTCSDLDVFLDYLAIRYIEEVKNLGVVMVKGLKCATHTANICSITYLNNKKCKPPKEYSADRCKTKAV